MSIWGYLNNEEKDRLSARMNRDGSNIDKYAPAKLHRIRQRIDSTNNRMSGRYRAYES
jgi:hypothetical protein